MRRPASLESKITRREVRTRVVHQSCRRLASPYFPCVRSVARTGELPPRGSCVDPVMCAHWCFNDCRIVFMITTLRKKLGEVPNRAKKGGKFGTSLWKNTLICGRAPLLSTMTVNAYACVDVNAYVNAISQKPGPFLGHLSQSRSKFPRRRSTPTSMLRYASLGV